MAVSCEATQLSTHGGDSGVTGKCALGLETLGSRSKSEWFPSSSLCHTTSVFKTRTPDASTDGFFPF